MSAGSDWLEEPEGNNVLAVQVAAMALHPLRIVRRRWKWMLPALVLGLVATAVGTMLITPSYRAQATVIVSSQQIPEEFVRSTVQGLDTLANVNSLMGEVLSQRRLGGLIEEHQLYGSLREGLPLAEIVGMMRGQVEFKQQENIARGRRSRNEASSIYSISFTYPDAKMAATVANEMAGIFVDANLKKRSEQAQVTTDFLERQLVRAESALRDVNRSITEFRETHRGEMPGDEEGILRKLERLEIMRQTVTAQIGVVEDRLVGLRAQDEQQSTPELMLDELKLQLASELAVHTEEHPNVIALRRRIERMEAEVDGIHELLPEAESATEQDRITMAENELRRLREQVADLDMEVAELDQRAARIPVNHEKLAALEERAAVLREDYVEFLRKVQDAELAEKLETSQQGSKVSVLDKASVPTEPTRSLMLYRIAGVILSLGLGVGVGLLLEFADPVILSAEHLEAVGHPPLLGSVHEMG